MLLISFCVILLVVCTIHAGLSRPQPPLALLVGVAAQRGARACWRWYYLTSEHLLPDGSSQSRSQQSLKKSRSETLRSQERCLKGQQSSDHRMVCRNLSRSPRHPPAPCIVMTVLKTVLDHTRSACLKHQGRACTMLKYTL